MLNRESAPLSETLHWRISASDLLASDRKLMKRVRYESKEITLFITQIKTQT